MRSEEKQVRRLNEAVDESRERREIKEREERDKRERRKQVDDSPPYKRVDFFCKPCGFDFNALGVKMVSDGSKTWERPLRAVYQAKCPNCHEWQTRRITDKALDPYYRESIFIRRERSKYAKDLIQPGDPRFIALYGDPRKKYWEKVEQEEREAFENNKQISRVL